MMRPSRFATLIIMILGFGSVAHAQDGLDRQKVEAEATGQAAEADRRFKAKDFKGALPLYRAERASRSALGDVRYEAYAFRAIGCCEAELGDDEAAIASWHRARALDAKREDRGFEGYDWLLIGRAHLRRDRPADALRALETGLPKLSPGGRSRPRGRRPPGDGGSVAAFRSPCRRALGILIAPRPSRWS